MAEKLSDTVVIRGANGKKICSIKTYQSMKDYWGNTEIKPGDKPFVWMTISHKVPVWKDPGTVILWAWKQVISSANDVSNNNMPSTCIICGEKSINYNRQRLYRDRWVGVSCTNPKCKMYRVMIPAKMFTVGINDIPLDKLSE
jgi:hypothetical protein